MAIAQLGMIIVAVIVIIPLLGNFLVTLNLSIYPIQVRAELMFLVGIKALLRASGPRSAPRLRGGQDRLFT